MGMGVGVVAAVLWRVGVRPSWGVGGVLVGAVAMASSDVPLAGLGVSDPRTWSAADWLADAVPHLVFGLVTFGAVAAWEGRV
ncbi:hypothetical protein [Peterkaempfera sp. SMS 1(5)a]|uniref:hypothetical protein n=1 Tax=Peterkaempfera podocarpi TaxID=3232308 RepID=UPI00366E804A